MIVRELAAGDPVAAQRILDWPLREALLEYLRRAKERALTTWQASCLEWAVLAPWIERKKSDPRPKMPFILQARV